MRLSPQERQARREAFGAMGAREKADYILSYYKLPLVLALIALTVLGSALRWQLTHTDPVLYVAFANVSVSDKATRALTDDFLEHADVGGDRAAVHRYEGLYLSANANEADHQYAYASNLKTLAAIEAEELDVVLMNQEAWDILSNSGYLLDLSECLSGLDARTASRLEPLLMANTVIVDDNQIEVNLGEADTYEATTHEEHNAFRITSLDALGTERLSGEVYLGVIANSPRMDAVEAYLRYLA